MTSESNTVAVVRAILDRPDDELDYASAKIAFDRLVDPSFDAEAVRRELERLTNTAGALAGAGADAVNTLDALRRTLYVSGPWNGCRPFSYDQADPLGRQLSSKLLYKYLERRLGQCVSMPALFLILGERLGLNVALAAAPEHMFVRFGAGGGQWINLEATSGAHPARDEWYIQNLSITDRAIQTGIYMRTLGKREGIALLATVVAEHSYALGRFNDVIDVCGAILRYSPRDAQAMVVQGSAYGVLFEQFRHQHPDESALTPLQRSYVRTLAQQNYSLIAEAERLGWVPINDQGAAHPEARQSTSIEASDQPWRAECM